MANRDDELEQTIAFVSADYEDRGYHVVVAPSDDLLSAELGSMSVDMIAVRDDDRVLIEIKRRVGKGRPERDSVRLARLAEAAGWRVEFVLADPYGVRERPSARVERSVRDRVAAALQEGRVGETDLGSTAEASQRIHSVFRLILAESSESDVRTFDLLVSAWSLGYIVEQHEYDALFAVVAAAHEEKAVDRVRRAEAEAAMKAAHQRWVNFPADRE